MPRRAIELPQGWGKLSLELEERKRLRRSISRDSLVVEI